MHARRWRYRLRCGHRRADDRSRGFGRPPAADNSRFAGRPGRPTHRAAMETFFDRSLETVAGRSRTRPAFAPLRSAAVTFAVGALGFPRHPDPSQAIPSRVRDAPGTLPGLDAGGVTAPARLPACRSRGRARRPGTRRKPAFSELFDAFHFGASVYARSMDSKLRQAAGRRHPPAARRSPAPGLAPGAAARGTWRCREPGAAAAPAGSVAATAVVRRPSRRIGAVAPVLAPTSAGGASAALPRADAARPASFPPQHAAR